MSVHVSSAVWKHSKATGTKLLVLLSLADYANDEGIAWPSVASLATRCRLSERQVQYHLRTLRESGELSVVARGGGRSKSTMYRIECYVQETTQPIAGYQPENMQPIAGNSGKKRVQSSVQTVQSGVQKGAMDCTRSVNTHQEPSEKKKDVMPQQPRLDAKFSHPAVKDYIEVFGDLPNDTQIKLMERDIGYEDCGEDGRWRETLERWHAEGYRLGKVQSMIDAHHKGFYADRMKKEQAQPQEPQLEAW